jgi:hypothetical protein
VRSPARSPTPPPPRTNRTRRVPHPVLIGHAALHVRALLRQVRGAGALLRHPLASPAMRAAGAAAGPGRGSNGSKDTSDDANGSKGASAGGLGAAELACAAAPRAARAALLLLLGSGLGARPPLAASPTTCPRRRPSHPPRPLEPLTFTENARSLTADDGGDERPGSAALALAPLSAAAEQAEAAGAPRAARSLDAAARAPRAAAPLTCAAGAAGGALAALVGIEARGPPPPPY